MKSHFRLLVLLGLVGCAGVQRDCASCSAGSFGSDWVIVQYKNDGVPISCWQLRQTSVSNETQSDGIFWQDSTSGHLIHLSGWYNRVQVSHGDYESAAKAVGVDIARCKNGHYDPAPLKETP